MQTHQRYIVKPQERYDLQFLCRIRFAIGAKQDFRSVACDTVLETSSRCTHVAMSHSVCCLRFVELENRTLKQERYHALQELPQFRWFGARLPQQTSDL